MEHKNQTMHKVIERKIWWNICTAELLLPMLLKCCWNSLRDSIFMCKMSTNSLLYKILLKSFISQVIFLYCFTYDTEEKKNNRANLTLQHCNQFMYSVCVHSMANTVVNDPHLLFCRLKKKTKKKSKCWIYNVKKWKPLIYQCENKQTKKKIISLKMTFVKSFSESFFFRCVTRQSNWIDKYCIANEVQQFVCFFFSLSHFSPEVERTTKITR